MVDKHRIIDDERKSRIDDLYGFISSKRLKIKWVAEHAGLNYSSIWVNMKSYNLSIKRIEKMEKAAKQLSRSRSCGNAR